MFSKLFKLLLLAFVLGCAGIIWYAWYESTPVLQPYTPSSVSSENKPGLNFEYFEFTGADGIPVKACIASRGDASNLTPKQARIRDLLKLRGKITSLDRQEPVILICTSWDNGIENSISYAEAMTSAGYTCVLWDPRGKDNAREYCTYGYREADDVPLLIDTLEKKFGKDTAFAAIGKDFGASVLMLAAPKDKRIRSLVSIDNFCILRAALLSGLQEEMSKHAAYAKLWLIDIGMELRAGFRSFDVVPVDAARQLSIPVMLVCANEYYFSSLNDTATIFDALQTPWDKRSIYVPLEKEEPYGTKKRTYTIVHELKDGKTKRQEFPLDVYDGDDELMANIAEWLPAHTLPPLPEVILHKENTIDNN